MTRDSAGNPGAGGAWGPPGPSGRRRPYAGPGPLPPPDRELSDIPGYEFEGGSAPGPPALPPRVGRGGNGSRAARGPAGNEPPAAAPRDAEGEPRRFRYTPTVRRPPSVPPPIWPRDDLVIPGFEFDRHARAAVPFGQEPFSPKALDPEALDP